MSNGRAARQAAIRITVGAILASALLTITAAGASAASAPRLVKDINTHTAGSSANGPTAELGGFTYFRADDGVHGFELWRTNGTPNGTHLVKDTLPGSEGIDFNDFEIIAAGGRILFLTDCNLWRSDGTAAGTTVLRSFAEDPDTGGCPGGMTELAGNIYFNGYTPATGAELFRSDGTVGGTVPLDLVAGANGSNPRWFAVRATKIYFAANGPQGRELYGSDGTVGGTAQVANIHPTGDSDPQWLVTRGTHIWFSADDGMNGAELWRSDGTTASMFANIFPGAIGSGPEEITVLQDFPDTDLVFVASENFAGQSLWVYDGDSMSVSELTDDIDFPCCLAGAAGHVYFSAHSTAAGREPWITDGSAPGTELLVDVEPGPEGSSGAGFDFTQFTGTPTSGKVAFRAFNSPNGGELWIDDAGSTALVELVPGPTGSGASAVARIGNRVLIGSRDSRDAVGDEPRLSDGTVAGTSLLRDVNARNGDSGISDMGAIGDKALFFAFAPAVTFWRSDGTTPGTVALGGPAPFPDDLTVAGDLAFFRASSPAAGEELWATSLTGTPYLVEDINPGTDDGFPYNFVAVGDIVYFNADDGSNGSELWRSDGTAAGTRMVRDIDPGGSSSLASEVVALGDRILFTAEDAISGYELWRTDGTESGTVRVRDINPGTGGAASGTPVPFGRFAYFAASDGSRGPELWRSDGTEAGTTLVSDIVPGSTGSAPSRLAATRRGLFFSATTAAAGEEPWRSRGTAASTSLVRDIVPGSSGSDPRDFTDLAGGVAFVADDGIHGREVWGSNGTAAGTTLLRDIHTPEIDPFGDFDLFRAAVFGGQLYFAAEDAAHGLELWRTDGTFDGTALLRDFIAGPASGGPRNLTVAGSRLLFSADDGVHGDELWAIDAARCGGRAATLEGTPGRNTLTGTPGRDVIVAGAGVDRVRGLGGADVVCGGAGFDDVFGGAGNDRVLGGAGGDAIRGGGGRDQLFGNAGNDRLLGGTGNDRLLGGAGRDTLLGGKGGRDFCSGGPGRDPAPRGCELPA